MNESDFTEVALPFAVLILQDVALALFAAKHLARGSNFEPFGNGFSRFGYTGIFGHRGGECRGSRPMGNQFFALLEMGAISFVGITTLGILKSGNQKMQNRKN